MILSGSTERNLVYIDANGYPRIRKCHYVMSDGVVTLAYPPNYCDYHRSSVYPEQDRDLWDMSTLKYRYAQDSRCLGNEGTVLIAWPDGCRCGVQYDEVNKDFVDGIWATATRYSEDTTDVVAMAVATRADNTMIGRFSYDDPYVRYRNGVAGAVLPDSDVVADDFVFQRPNFDGVTIPDEFGYGRATGGSSYAYVSGKILVEVPESFGEPSVSNISVRMLGAVDIDGTKRPKRNFISNILQNPQTIPHIRIASTLFNSQAHKRLALIDILFEAPVLYPESYLHLFCPYVCFKDTKQEQTVMEYWIHDMALSVRFVDSIRAGAT